MNNVTYNEIKSLIPEGARVLDLGCGNGDLLATLKKEKNIYGYGIEKSFDNIKACTQKGIPVFHGNIDEGLKQFSDKSYDIVILSQTLQEIYDPIDALKDMLRIGKDGIVTFPNFGHWRIRLNMSLTGFSPKSPSLPYEWYNTPNIRVITINDFKHLCKENNINILPIPNIKNSNLFSERGMFRLQKN